MIVYRIGILPLIKNLKQAISDVTQPWYADDTGALGTFARLETYFDSLTLHGLGRGYHLKLSKILLIIHPDNLEDGKLFGVHHVFMVCTGARYLGGYIGDDNYKRDWLRGHTMTWEKNVNTISKTAGIYTQESYAVLVRAI